MNTAATEQETNYESALALLLWKIRHSYPDMVVEVTADEKRQFEASLAYTKQEPHVKVVERPNKTLIVLVDKGDNAIRACESDESEQKRAEAARARQRAHEELRQQLLPMVQAQAARGEFSQDAILTLCGHVQAIIGQQS